MHAQLVRSSFLSEAYLQHSNRRKNAIKNCFAAWRTYNSIQHQDVLTVSQINFLNRHSTITYVVLLVWIVRFTFTVHLCNWMSIWDFTALLLAHINQEPWFHMWLIIASSYRVYCFCQAVADWKAAHGFWFTWNRR